ncbi:hypothetical protein AAKU64_000042 [Undibacterium sp. GrIS 1.8]|uniref:hypothetical protein n=1 Tax=Undibacterium sp. GrIS 1.8 TaxID=3143934 RepID=UPI00339B0BF5
MEHSSKKFWIVTLGTLALIPLILMMPGVYDSMPTRVGIMMGIGPLALLAGGASSVSSWQKSSFFCGLALIMLGIGFFALQGGFATIAKIAETNGRFSKEDVKFWSEGIELWIYSVPVISIGIGINVVSAYISSERPSLDGNTN